MIIERKDVELQIKDLKKWLLVYGRRKTGKTFIIRNFIPYDEYFFVKSDKNLLLEDRQIDYGTFIEILRRALEQNKTVVVDEFHRLGKDFFDTLHAMEKNGKLILISSTLFLSKKLISERSPLLGLFAEVPVGLIALNDTLQALKNTRLSKKEMLEVGILLREPIAIDYFDTNKSARDILSAIIHSSIITIPALIGEIFVEEERDISAIYEGILRAVAVNKATSGEIASYIFSKRLMNKDDPSSIQQYLSNLLSFGVLKRIEVFNKKRFFYKHVSPLAKVFYYLDEKYNFAERKVDFKELQRIIEELMPRLVEDNVREILAEKYGLRESIFETKDIEIDGLLLRMDKPEVAIEVKWGEISLSDLNKIQANFDKILAKRKILFVQDKTKVKFNGELMDVSDLIRS